MNLHKSVGVNSRYAALEMLLAGVESHQFSGELKGSDRALAYRIVQEVVIWRNRLDRAISAYSKIPLTKIDRKILFALRIGAAQLLIMDTPPYAAVNCTVGAIGKNRAKSFLNGVLRELVRRGEPPFKNGDIPDYWSHSPDLVERWNIRYGAGTTLELIRWNNSIPTLGGYCFEDIPCGKQGVFLDRYRVFERRDGETPERISGVYIQDEAAAIVGRGFRELSGKTVLEIGACPGGKTVHLSEEGRTVFSVDVSLQKFFRWTENVEYYNLHNCFPIVAEGQFPPVRELDSVFLDAPCTNTGVYRRRTDARWKWNLGYLDRSVKKQRMLLDGAASVVKPGGNLVYSTCSLEPEENEKQVIWFEKNHTEYTRITFPVSGDLVSEGLLSIFPVSFSMDGHFAVVWKRKK